MIGQPVFLEGTHAVNVGKSNQPKKFLRFKDLHFINKRAIKNFDQMNIFEQKGSKPQKIVIKKFKNNQK